VFGWVGWIGKKTKRQEGLVAHFIIIGCQCSVSCLAICVEVSALCPARVGRREKAGRRKRWRDLPDRARNKATICGLPEDAPNSSINIDITINNNNSEGEGSSAEDQQPEAESETKKSKRQVVAFFQAPKHYTREEMLSDLWEDCVVGQDAGCLELPAEQKVYSKEEMMSDAWEDCVIGVDADCIALPDN